MAFLALLKFGLQKFAVGKPLGIHHPAIYVIMQYLYLTVILGIEDERLVVVLWIMLHCRPYNICKSLTSFTHICRMGIKEILCPVSEVKHSL